MSDVSEEVWEQRKKEVEDAVLNWLDADLPGNELFTIVQDTARNWLMDNPEKLASA